ncbi:hypothetical protein AXX17_AT5G01780 [Arabidopsis thaliana]|uniref:Uncharacterized protein n=1 Tax=Arabidopsis thaliana TaxID=3702 RepID=A0A178U6N8_ARATH|nr:hypothetical protein AXX17_AT5G01780 [Arabidopsis thaliana]
MSGLRAVSEDSVRHLTCQHCIGRCDNVKAKPSMNPNIFLSPMKLNRSRCIYC